MSFSRRDFLKIMGITGVVAHPFVAQSAVGKVLKAVSEVTFKGISPQFGDQLVTASGIDWKILIKGADAIVPGLSFGDGNDYLQYFPLTTPRHGILWVNHEYVNPLFFSGQERTKANVDKEMEAVGGSLLEIKQDDRGWSVVPNSTYNRRLTAKTVIPFAWDQPIAGKTEAIGTFANCAGGKTPWGTVLSCEENFDMFFGDWDRNAGKRTPSTWYGWEKFYDHDPRHYGWIVEVNPTTGAAKKLIAPGRFAREAATIRQAKDGRCVVYSGDDTNDQFIYKFIASNLGSLEKGTLYVADTVKGKWIPLVHSDERLKKVFRDQTEILTHCREAGQIVGATPQDRPEDIEIDPFTGDVLIALTNNKVAGRPFGKILKIKERHNDPLALTFSSETFLEGGEKGGFACPDNMAFDRKGNLWFTTDMSGGDMHKDHLQNFGNNGLFVVMRTGPQQGIPVQVAAAPSDAEFTGPLFSPDGDTLFLSVQHPGEQSKSQENPTSHWPSGGIPRSAVVTLQGPLLKKITGA